MRQPKKWAPTIKDDLLFVYFALYVLAIPVVLVLGTVHMNVFYGAWAALMVAVLFMPDGSL